MTLRCAWCHDDLAAEPHVTCAGCATLVHASCRGAACPTAGCGATWPAPTKRRTVGRVAAGLAVATGALLGVAAGTWAARRPRPLTRDQLGALWRTGSQPELHALEPRNVALTGDDPRLPAAVRALGARGVLLHRDRVVIELAGGGCLVGLRRIYPDDGVHPRVVYLYGELLRPLSENWWGLGLTEAEVAACPPPRMLE